MSITVQFDNGKFADLLIEGDEDSPVKYLATNKINTPSAHTIRSDSASGESRRSSEDSKQDLGLGDNKVRDSDGASCHQHILMLTYSLLRFGPESCVSKACRFEHS